MGAIAQSPIKKNRHRQKERKWLVVKRRIQHRHSAENSLAASKRTNARKCLVKFSQLFHSIPFIRSYVQSERHKKFIRSIIQTRRNLYTKERVDSAGKMCCARSHHHPSTSQPTPAAAAAQCQPNKMCVIFYGERTLE